MVIADTNVVSEFRRDTLDPALPEGRRRRELQQGWTRLLDTFAETVLLYYLLADRETAAVWWRPKDPVEGWLSPMLRLPESAWPVATTWRPASSGNSLAPQPDRH